MTATLTLSSITYKGFTIQKDQRNPYGDAEFMFYPTEEGVQHDADCDGESYKYCGNCKWASTLEEAKNEIDDKLYDDLERLNRAEKYARANGWESKIVELQAEQNELFQLIKSA